MTRLLVLLTIAAATLLSCQPDTLTREEVVQLIQEHSTSGQPGPQGPMGPQGPQGEPGVDGETGARGPQGEPGLTGPQGPRGFDGKDGSPGTQGPVGPAGPRGEKGVEGQVGLTGPPGPTGSAGPKGDRGEPGPQGEQGAAGPEGSQGPEGKSLEISLAEFVQQDLSPSQVQEKLDVNVDGVVHVRAYITKDTGASGTGFIFHVEDGTAYVLTAAHILDAPYGKELTFYVRRDDGRVYEAELVYKSDTPSVDMASLKIECDDCTALAFSTESLLRYGCFRDSTCAEIPSGIKVVSVTYNSIETGVEIVYGETLETTYIFGFEPPEDIEHTTYLVKGDSGSPLLNTDGYVIGMNQEVSDAGQASALYLVYDEANAVLHNTIRRAREDKQR